MNIDIRENESNWPFLMARKLKNFQELVLIEIYYKLR
jgi:hypothetical protein